MDTGVIIIVFCYFLQQVIRDFVEYRSLRPTRFNAGARCYEKIEERQNYLKPQSSQRERMKWYASILMKLHRLVKKWEIFAHVQSSLKLHHLFHLQYFKPWYSTIKETFFYHWYLPRISLYYTEKHDVSLSTAISYKIMFSIFIAIQISLDLFL